MLIYSLLLIGTLCVPNLCQNEQIYDNIVRQNLVNPPYYIQQLYPGEDGVVPMNFNENNIPNVVQPLNELEKVQPSIDEIKTSQPKDAKPLVTKQMEDQEKLVPSDDKNIVEKDDLEISPSSYYGRHYGGWGRRSSWGERGWGGNYYGGRGWGGIGIGIGYGWGGRGYGYGGRGYGNGWGYGGGWRRGGWGW